MAGTEINSSSFKALLSEAERLRKRLERLRHLQEGTKASLMDSLSDYAKLDSLYSSWMEDLADLEDEEEILPPLALSHLFRLLYRYQSQGFLSQMAERLYAQYKDRFETHVRTLEEAGGSVKWFFLSSSSKEKLQKEYEEAEHFFLEEFGDEIAALEKDASDIDGVDRASSLELFHLDPSSYERTMKELYPEGFAVESSLEAFSFLKRELAYQKKRLMDAFSLLDESKKSVRRSANAQASETAVSLLKDIPIEEVNRGERAVRVATLKNAGFTTYYDVYRVGWKDLQKVNGISEAVAKDVNDAVDESYRKLRSTSRVRLSSDNRSLASTELLRSIDWYISSKKALEERKKLEKEYGETIEKNEEILDSFQNGFSFLFLPLEEKRKFVSAYKALVELLKGDYTQRIGKMETLLKDGPGTSTEDLWKGFGENSVVYINVLEELVPSLVGGNEEVQYGLPTFLAEEVGKEILFTDGLNCTLRKYQEWGVKYILHQKRVLLGDEMGLGKTVQAIGTMVSLANQGHTHFMVVCPAGVLANWCREVEKFSFLKSYRIHGNGKEEELAVWKEKGGVAVATFESSGTFDEEIRPSLLVIDEAHYVKNKNAQRTQRVLKLAALAERVLFMTGTALENKVEEMIALLGALRPDLKGYLEANAFMAAAPQFRESISSVYYRRRRADVLTELPGLMDKKEWCSLEEAERKAYEASVLDKNYSLVRRVSWAMEDLESSSKAKTLEHIIEEAQEDGRKIIVFSFFLDTISKIMARLGDKCYGPINGSIPPMERQGIVDEFSKGPAGSVLAAQIQAGGTGLNIQAASVIILCEPQLKPSIENQAIGRAYRMGQTRNVLVYRLLAEGTADEKIMETLEYKQSVFDAFADESEADKSLSEIDEKTFSHIMEEERERILKEQEKEASQEEESEVAEEETALEVETPMEEAAEETVSLVEVSESPVEAEKETL